MKRAIVAMGGGPTRVINRSVFGIVDEAARNGIEVMAARHGITGVLKEDFIPLTPGSPPVSTHALLPGAMAGSTRHKPNQADCEKAFSVFRDQEAHFFFYIGGNDTAEATSIINREAKKAGYELRCFHCPKTIDNDLVESDHTPGYGSAARFVANALIGDDLDVKSLPGIKINIIMGRKAGWLTAATALGRRDETDGPHLLYFPEFAKSLEELIEEILGAYEKNGYAVAAVSEGLHGPDQVEFIASEYIRKELAQEPYAPIMRTIKAMAGIEKATGGPKKDAFGHVQLSGTGTLADVLAAAVKIASYKRYGKAVRCRADTFGYLQRSYAGDVSPVDAEEAEMVGRAAVKLAVKEDTDGSVALRAERDGKYLAYTELVSLEAVAGKERYMPREFFNEDGNGVTKAFVEYAKPIVGELAR